MNASSLFWVALTASIGITAVVASGSCLNNCGTYVNTDGVYCYCKLESQKKKRMASEYRVCVCECCLVVF